MKRRWRSLIGTVTQERFLVLRYHLLCEQPGICRDRLFKAVRERIRTSRQTYDLLDALETRTALFAAFADADHDDWTVQGPARRHVRDLILLRTRHRTPLLLAVWERFSPRPYLDPEAGRSYHVSLRGRGLTQFERA